jgi:hypothetical protein
MTFWRGVPIILTKITFWTLLSSISLKNYIGSVFRWPHRNTTDSRTDCATSGNGAMAAGHRSTRVGPAGGHIQVRPTSRARMPGTSSAPPSDAPSDLRFHAPRRPGPDAPSHTPLSFSADAPSDTARPPPPILPLILPVFFSGRFPSSSSGAPS